MAWTLTDSDSGQSVTFAVASGDTQVKREQPTSINYPLRGTSPMVLSGRARVANLVTPEWIVTGPDTWAVMEPILASGHRLVITDDMGTTYGCRVVGGYDMRVEDTPDRRTNPRRRVTVQLVGIA